MSPPLQSPYLTRFYGIMFYHFFLMLEYMSIAQLQDVVCESFVVRFVCDIVCDVRGHNADVG